MPRQRVIHPPKPQAEIETGSLSAARERNRRSSVIPPSAQPDLSAALCVLREAHRGTQPGDLRCVCKNIAETSRAEKERKLLRLYLRTALYGLRARGDPADENGCKTFLHPDLQPAADGTASEIPGQAVRPDHMGPAFRSASGKTRLRSEQAACKGNRAGAPATCRSAAAEGAADKDAILLKKLF